MAIYRIFPHSIQAAKQLAAAYGMTTRELLGAAITPEAIKDLSPIDVRPEPIIKVPGRKGKPRLADGPTLSTEFLISGHTGESLRAASKRLGCPVAQIVRVLADRRLGGLLHATAK
jgi:hypothetical protein